MRRFDKARVLAAVEIKLKMMSMKSAAPVPPNTPPFPLFDAVHADIIADLVIANALKHPEQMSAEETWADHGDFVDWQAPQVCGVPVATRRGMISPPKSGHGASPGKARGMNGELLTGTATGFSPAGAAAASPMGFGAPPPYFAPMAPPYFAQQQMPPYYAAQAQQQMPHMMAPQGLPPYMFAQHGGAPPPPPPPPPPAAPAAPQAAPPGLADAPAAAAPQGAAAAAAGPMAWPAHAQMQAQMQMAQMDMSMGNMFGGGGGGGDGA